LINYTLICAVVTPMRLSAVYCNELSSIPPGAVYYNSSYLPRIVCLHFGTLNVWWWNILFLIGLYTQKLCVCVCVCVERVKNCSIFELSRTTIFCSIYLFFSIFFFNWHFFILMKNVHMATLKHITFTWTILSRIECSIITHWMCQTL